MPADPTAAAAQWYDALPPADQAQVDRIVKQLALHPRMQGKHFGQNSALELVYCLHEWALTLPAGLLEGSKA